MQYKQLFIAILSPAVIAMSILPANAAGESKKKPVSSWTCSDFLAVDDAFKPKIIYAASIVSQGAKPAAALIDIAGTEEVTPMIIDDCSKMPMRSFVQTLKSDWSKVKTDVKSDAAKVEKNF